MYHNRSARGRQPSRRGPAFRFLTPLLHTSPLAILLIIFAVTLVVFGGSSRYDQLAQVPVRLVAILVIAAASLTASEPPGPALRLPALWLGAAVMLVCLQLVPLPPALWMALPGHAELAAAATTGGFAQPWRPVSIAPDYTVNSLLSLTVPVATLFGLARLSPRHRHLILPVLLLAIAATLVTSFVQLTTGSQFQWRGTAPGIFTNRNHHALLLATGLPLLAGWADLRPGTGLSVLNRWVAGGMAIMIVIAIVMAGSRSGLLVGGLGFLGAAAIVWGRYPLRWSGRSRRLWILPVGGMALLTVLVASAAFLGRAQAIDRLLAADPMADKRTRTLSTVTDVLWTYFPIGSGFGSFDVAFRQAEPFRLLEGTYFNQAHDDLIQVILEGGIVGLALLVTLLIWLGWSTIRAWRGPGSSQAGACARASSTALLLLVLASTVDYPLRTPTMMAIAVVLVFLLATSQRQWQGEISETGLALPKQEPRL